MNAQRRKEIAKAIALIEDAIAILDSVAEEEREAYDNLPESLQYSEHDERMEECADAIEYVSSELTDQIDSLNDAIE
mgnify:CR=1 FL=1